MAISVRDANNDVQTVQTLPAVSRAAAASSLPMALSTEDKAALDALATQTTSAAILAKLPAVGTAGTASTNVVTVQGIASGTVIPISDGGGSLTVDGTFFQATQPVSIATAPALVASSAIIGNVRIDQTTPGTTNGTVPAGNVAHDAADSGNPVKMGAKATSSAPSAVASGDRSNLYTDTFGSLRVIQTDSAGAVLDYTTPADISLKQINGNTVAAGNGVAGTGTQRVTIASDNTPFGVRLAQDEYETVAASQTDQVLGPTGASGDYLAQVWIQPGTTTPGTVVVKDGSTTVYTFPGGASSVSNLVPFCWAPGIKSVSGSWKITTGANVTVQATGDFT